MLWALDKNGKKIKAVTGRDGMCPLCKGKVFPKCGELNAHHWAHFKTRNCDSWYEPETHWHAHWKMTFGKENTEIIIKGNDESHRADVLTNEGVVIELQNSPIQKSMIREREEFYGEKMLWLINGIRFKENFQIKDYDDRHINRHYILESKSPIGKKYFDWRYAHKSWGDVKRPVFIDFGEDSLFWVKEGMGESHGRGFYVPKEKFVKKYGGNFEYYCQQT